MLDHQSKNHLHQDHAFPVGQFSQQVSVQQSGGIAMAKALQEMAAKAKTMPAPSRADTAPWRHFEFLDQTLGFHNLGLPQCPGEHQGKTL